MPAKNLQNISYSKFKYFVGSEFLPTNFRKTKFLRS